MPGRSPPHALRIDAQGAGEASPVDALRLVEGRPDPRAWNGYTDPTGQFFAGVWSAAAGRWRVAYGDHEEEFCVLLEGEVLLIDSAGNTTQFKAGDAFVVPGGFEGEWVNLGPVRKHYAIMNLKETP
jgi:uncharacterized cupin superfamily protein